MTHGGGAGLVPSLAWADLKHEWVLSLCLFLAVAAVIGPLLLLFGLKNGTMETLRGRLLEDPRNREIRPMVSRSFTPQWLDQLKNNPKVDFLVPATRSISASVELISKGNKLVLEALPSAPGDPLLLENHARPPEKKECVLSWEAARKLDVQTGQTLSLLVKRLKGSGFESGATTVTVSGIADPRATARVAAFFPLPLLEAVEAFKDGQAVPELGWNGRLPVAGPVFDGVVLGLDQPMDPVLKVRLISGTGLSHVTALPEGSRMESLGYPLTLRPYIYLLSTKTAVPGSVLTTMANRLRGKNPLILPWVSPIDARLETSQNISILAFPSPPAPEFAWNDSGPGGKNPRQIILPKGLNLSGQPVLSLPGKGLEFPVQVRTDQFSQGAWALVPPDLAGILNLARKREIRWDDHKDQFILHRRGYAAFRMYARTMDHVPDLKLELEGMGIPVHTEAERIRDLKELDRHLSMIFWLIALGGILGGAGALAASLYASVERKRKDLGVLGLIGFGRGSLLSFPLYQALFLSCGGFALALGFYLVMAGLINHLFSSQLSAGEHFCRLYSIHLAAAAWGVVILGQIAAALAAFRVVSIDPAEALRDE
ncbi:ABC transporter permease [Desulfobacter vibrioformis]|uniref:ABC transporter permease n=1 Tax=Desulfobacter vibrioformis TaxID=34031 RepID=UPI00068AF461|nr:ABC transporter permease [Desulfobacter vibrioformis]